jgi:hypothetical protein
VRHRSCPDLLVPRSYHATRQTPRMPRKPSTLPRPWLPVCSRFLPFDLPRPRQRWRPRVLGALRARKSARTAASASTPSSTSSVWRHTRPWHEPEHFPARHPRCRRRPLRHLPGTWRFSRTSRPAEPRLQISRRNFRPRRWPPRHPPLGKPALLRRRRRRARSSLPARTSLPPSGSPTMRTPSPHRITPHRPPGRSNPSPTWTSRRLRGLPPRASGRAAPPRTCSSLLLGAP